jgi:Domain of unknown function (DUF4249)
MKANLYVIALMVIATSCKQVFEPKISSPSLGYLVVEGFINSGSGVSTITLSRTVKLVDTVLVVYEHNAQVAIENSNSESFPLSEGINGNYTSAVLSLNSNLKYRVRIITQGGNEYLSDFTAVRFTPAIDSISWAVENGGVRLYVNTHDDQNNTKYYRWTYSETWEFHSPFLKALNYIIDPVSNLAVGLAPSAADTTIYKCWRTQNSTDILLGSSEKLSTDKIFLPIRYIEPQSDELSVLYYIQLKQYSLTQNAYLFYQKLKKNTEQVGTLFDPQPSELGGNIHCINDPAQLAIGFIEVSQEQEKELFVHHDDLPINWLPHIPCAKVELQNKPPLNQGLIPIGVATLGPFNSIATYYAADAICVDCTLRGTNVKPSFWP